MIFHEVTFGELWETIMAIEPATAALAARKRTAADLDLIDDNIARTRASLSDGQTLVSLDIEFHGLVAGAAANRAIVLAREALSQLIYPAFKAVLVDGSANVAGRGFSRPRSDCEGNYGFGYGNNMEVDGAAHLRFSQGL